MKLLKSNKNTTNNYVAASFPSRVILELTNQCNLSCVMCPRKYSKTKSGFLDYELFKKVIDEISFYDGVCLVPFFRGESLLHPDFAGILKYITLKKITPVQLSTNGILLDDRMSDAILNSSISFISFSLDGFDEATYNKIRIGGDFSLVVRNITRFLKKKKLLNKKLPEVQVSMVKTVHTENVVSNFVSQWIDKVDRVRVYEEHSSDGDFGHLKNSLIKSINARKPCLKLINEIAIYYNGEVALCNHDWNRNDSIGNVKEEPIERIWTNKKYGELRRRHAYGEVGNDIICGKCDHWKAYYMPGGMIGKLYSKHARVDANIEF